MELRRLEALQNLSHGTSKVIFDLTKPYSDLHGAAGIAAAMADGEQRNVRVGQGGEDEESTEEPPTAAAQAAAIARK